MALRLTDFTWHVAECGEPSGLLVHTPELGARAAYMLPPRPVRMDVSDLIHHRVPFTPWDRDDAVMRLHYAHRRTAHPDSLYLD